MNKCSIVIGGLYGDEGKGHITDIICSKEKSLNVRFNGGAQASHTVQTIDGRRHAFRHFGSGTFSGATTYLSKDFIVNPVAFVLERDKIKKEFGITPKVFVNPNAIVTITWDMYINQLIEKMRGENRHGSCGFGINESILRNKNPKYRLTVQDLNDKDELRCKLQLIKDEYINEYIENEYGIDFKNDKEIDMFIFYAEEFLNGVCIQEDSLPGCFNNVVFEGAQGLSLDKDNSLNFPHVTPTKTGITNVMDIMSSNSFMYDGDINIYYVSRCYTTRHGAGPLRNELGKLPYSKICDLTNVENEFQGKLRYSYLDLDSLLENINNDLTNLGCKYLKKAKVHIVFTCFDETDEEIKFYYNNELMPVIKNKFFEKVSSILEERVPYYNGIYVTYGKTSEDIIKYSEEALKNISI